jgi:hypothetical protein
VDSPHTRAYTRIHEYETRCSSNLLPPRSREVLGPGPQWAVLKTHSIERTYICMFIFTQKCLHTNKHTCIILQKRSCKQRPRNATTHDQHGKHASEVSRAHPPVRSTPMMSQMSRAYVRFGSACPPLKSSFGTAFTSEAGDAPSSVTKTACAYGPASHTSHVTQKHNITDDNI